MTAFILFRRKGEFHECVAQLHMTFTLWKAAFREDCQHEHKLQALDAMGDSAMMLFYECGVDPLSKES